MRQAITAEQAEELRGIIKDIYVQHNLGISIRPPISSPTTALAMSSR